MPLNNNNRNNNSILKSTAYMEKTHLLPLLSSPTASTSSTAAAATTPPPTHEDILLNNNSLNNLFLSNSTILLRLSLVVSIGILSIWANHEASKGYAITVVNEFQNTFAGKRFQLFYVSNDEASRIVIKASRIIENILYPDSHGSLVKKLVRHVILKLSGGNLTEDIVVDSGTKHGEFVLSLSTSVMENSNFKHVMSAAVQKGMARVWLWEGQGNAPTNLIKGIVEYRGSTDHSGEDLFSQLCWKHNDVVDTRAVADFLSHCERRRLGFVRRLNQAMRDGWDDGIFDGAVGQPVENRCTECDKLLTYDISSV